MITLSLSNAHAISFRGELISEVGPYGTIYLTGHNRYLAYFNGPEPECFQEAAIYRTLAEAETFITEMTHDRRIHTRD